MHFRSASLRFFRLLMPEEGGDEEPLLVGGHLLPMGAIDGGASASREREQDDQRTADNDQRPGSRRQRWAIGICRPLPKAFIDTRMVGAAWRRLNSFVSTSFRMRATSSRSYPAAAMASTSFHSSM